MPCSRHNRHNEPDKNLSQSTQPRQDRDRLMDKQLLEKRLGIDSTLKFGKARERMAKKRLTSLPAVVYDTQSERNKSA